MKQRIIVKVGTSTLTLDNGRTDLMAAERLVRMVIQLTNQGNEVIVVSSGAIAVGREKIDDDSDLDSITSGQCAAAVGQCRNIVLYDRLFSAYDQTIAQILLCEGDLHNPERRENLTRTFEALLKRGFVPIVNENDSVCFEEICSIDELFGDNDMLSALVAVLTDADLLVFFSDIDGLYDQDPRLSLRARRIERITRIEDAMIDNVAGQASKRGRGGMKTKLQAAQLATSQGCRAVILNGKKPESLMDFLAGKNVGTVFIPDEM